MPAKLRKVIRVNDDFSEVMSCKHVWEPRVPLVSGPAVGAYLEQRRKQVKELGLMHRCGKCSRPYSPRPRVVLKALQELIVSLDKACPGWRDHLMLIPATCPRYIALQKALTGEKP